MPQHLRKPVALLLAWLLAAGPVAVAQPELPDFGSPADSVLSKTREQMLGRSVILQLRNAGVIIDDPQLNEYIGLLGSSLASQVNDGDFSFEFFVIEDDAINAFAMPGGVIGIHTGLLLATDNESELAGVIAHEVSHVTQRHIARAIYDRQRTSILSMAAVLAAALLGASGEGDAAVGAAAAAQAAVAQRQINFTRAHEYEADRIGMGVLARAGFDPIGMASFFEKLARRENRSTDLIPEILRTHPTGNDRISEARSRARQLPSINHTDSIAYGLAKARIRVLSARTPQAALDYYRLRADSPDPADRYGHALSLSATGRHDQAERIFRELSAENPTVIAFRIGRAEALMAAGLDDQAMAVFKEANALSPRNVPLVISYSKALIVSGRPADAHAILLDLLNNVDPAPAQIELIARAANAEGDVINAHHYMSEYYASIGNLPQAIVQLRMALEAPGLNGVQRARFNARITEFEEYLEETERRR
ncbi:MAG TPA: M48 family metalloprotease [Gammaproteobacteria bacterium]|nr:M48 family metalloprotease [Gammaproteobacteria bacterium]